QFDDVVYIPIDVAFGEYLSKAVFLDDEKTTDSLVMSDNTATNTMLSEKSMVTKVTDKMDSNRNTSESNDHSEQSKDLEFLLQFRENTKQKGLYYSDSDLVNFHISMKTDGMVILSGLSGTGKSKLVTEYATALKANIRFVPVRPFWADDSDLLGYADTVNNIYRPGDSGLIDTLIDAQDNDKSLFIVVFDEMNLARVEHYFSQFLSVLEMDSGDRMLTLYNQQLESRLYNSEKYPSNIRISDNVLFVGTVNTDESTYQFSDKVLDRSNVMTLKMIPFGSIDETVGSPVERSKREVIKASDFQKMKKVNTEAKLTSDEKNMLWEIHKALNNVDANIGIGWRIVRQIDKYLMNIPDDIDSYTREKAFDMQIIQRVLTKVRGSEDQMRALVGKDTAEGKHEPGKLENILDQYSDSSPFEGSRQVIARKSKELNLYGFTV
ncbi:MAG: McrB family protein, partial [Pseudolactococcus laudensis]